MGMGVSLHAGPTYRIDVRVFQVAVVWSGHSTRYPAKNRSHVAQITCALTEGAGNLPSAVSTSFAGRSVLLLYKRDVSFEF